MKDLSRVVKLLESDYRIYAATILDELQARIPPNSTVYDVRKLIETMIKELLEGK